MSIFADNAPLYWAKGLPAIPLIKGEKRPAINRWQLFADTKPSQEEMDVWVDHFHDGNIGMPMGPSSGLVAIDIDTDDPKIIHVLNGLLPPTPWTRVGKKGMVKIYRFVGERTCRIKHSDGTMICEILSKGTQIVLPPSIHPETKRPYTANCNLFDVIGAIPALPLGIEDLIRGCLQDLGIEVSVGGGNNKVTTFVPAGARDNTMVWHAGLLARAVTRGERSLLEALGEMEHWVTSFIEKVIGDPLSVEKAQSKIIEFLVRDVTGEKRVGLPIGWDEGLTDDDKQKLGLAFTEDDEKWTADKILNYLAVEFERFSDHNSEGRLNSINVALDKVARAAGTMSVLDEERVMKFITGQSAGSITIATLKKMINSLRRGDIAGENHQEIADAVLKFVDEYGEHRFDMGSWWQWKGAFWDKRDPSDLLKVISMEFGTYPACKRYSDYQGVLKVMQSLAQKPLKQNMLKGLNFANGFLTENFELVDHNPDQGMIYILPFRYMPELAGHMPIFNQFLADSWGHDPDYMDKVAALQEAIGSTIFGHATTYQRAVCLFGAPGSGKSRVTAILQGLLPPNAVSSIPPTDWGDKFLPAQMHGKVLNFAGELSESKSIPGDSFKKIVTGETISAQHKNMPAFEFRPMCAQWFSSNHLPKTRDSSDGFNRRWLILEWNRRVDAAKKIVDLDQIILEHEREAIVAWAVEGFQRLVKNNEYTLPSSHLACVDQMATDNNSVRYFLANCPTIIVGQAKMVGQSKTRISLGELHGEYWSFCIGMGIAQRVSLQGFQKMMKELQVVFAFHEALEPKALAAPTVSYESITLAPRTR
ncbi:phage/plasmid primase, P4 family [Mesorhizobium sp. M0016]|uniref:phage/plasmid primase, P4 family n=1 Tax=Mesorhizobium sp. M0016 TaxID=2956843 RepID=UPI00333DDFA2